MKEKDYNDNPYRKANALAGGFLLIIISILCLVSLFNGFGGVGAMIRGFLLGFFGLASYAYGFSTFLLGVLIMLQKRPRQSLKNIIFALLIFVFGLIIFQTTTTSRMINLSYGEYLTACYSVDFTAGGLFYGIITYPIMKAVTPLATIIVFSLLMGALAIIMAMPLVNKDLTSDYTKKNNARGQIFSSYKRDKTRNKPTRVDTPKEPSLTLFDDDSEEAIGDRSDNISYRRLDSEQMTDFEGNKKRSSVFKGLSKTNQDNEDNEFDENIDIDSVTNTEDKDLRRKEALRKLYPEKKDGLLNYDGGILEDIRKANMAKDEEEEDGYKSINLKEIIRQGNTEEGKKRLAEKKLEDIMSAKPSDEKDDTESPDAVEETLEDKCCYIDQYGIKRRYYGLDLQKTIEENEKKLLQKQQEKKAENAGKSVTKSERKNSVKESFSGSPSSNKAAAEDFNKINFSAGIENENTGNAFDSAENITGNPDKDNDVEEFIDIDELADIAEAKKETKSVTKKNSDFSFSKIMQEEKQKIYDRYDIKQPDGEILERFVQDDINNSPANINVNVDEDRRSDYGGSHKKKFMDESNIEFIKKALGRTESEEVPEIAIKEEKYPYIPKYITGGEYSYRPPKIDLLKAFDTHYQKAEDYQIKGRKIEETLRGLGIETKVVNYTQGPAFSRYELEVDPTINLARLVSARDNLSLALATKGSVRIEAPISGKSMVGIEVPNDKKVTVGLREIISSKEFYDPDSELSIALGKDIAGQIHVGDVNKLTHILIAGSTGSGKSVCLNSILTSILFKYSPEDVRLILIDPKRVELSTYNGIPHMLVPNAIKEPDQAISALKWLDREMVRRLELFEEVGSRNILGYNGKVEAEMKLPRIILVIDEFADIMVQSAKIGTEMEDLISRIARMARAVGIHLILATQRPSAEYITGSIKVNIPCKIAFATANGVNSRIIIDSLGAEKLLGNGDMLFVHRNPQPLRMQCPFLSDDEVTKIVDYVKDHNKCVFDDRISDEIMNCTIDKPQQPENTAPVKLDGKAKLDTMFLKVLKFLVEDNYNSPPSITKVQREFEMGFPRSAGLLDKMTKMGFLTKDSKKYNLNITMDEFNKLFGDDLNDEE